MATTVRNLDGLKADAAVTVLKQLRKDLLSLKKGTIFHADATTAASGTTTNLAAVMALANSLKAAYNTHCASACSATTGQGAHITADSNVVSTAAATDQTTANNLLNAIKAAYETHRASTTYHPTADATNTIAAADATDLATSQTLAAELLADINAHMAAAFTHAAIALVDP